MVVDGEIIEDDHHHATNEKPLDFSITKNVFLMIMIVFLIMFFMFKKNGQRFIQKQQWDAKRFRAYIGAYRIVC